MKITALAAPVSVQISEAGYTGGYTINAAQCAGIATAALAGQGLISVGGVATGQCALVLSDGFGQSVALPVTVTTSAITVK